MEVDIKDVLDSFYTNYNKLASFSQKANNELSKVDLELSDFYHKMEGVHLSHNTQGHGFIIQLKDILNRRRELKKETMLLRSFIDNTQGSMDKARNKGIVIIDKHDKLLESLKKSAE